jgi:predicted GIY-YIG superfamily endonuclease
MGIMDEVTSHMIPVGSRYKRLIYAYEFPDNSVYVGLTYDMSKRDYSHMNRESSAVYQYMLKTGLKPIKKTLTTFMDKTEASKMEGELEKKYKDNGWIILNRAKTGTLGGDVLIWKPEKIRQLFLQYDDLTKLYDEQPSAIQAAKREGMDFYKDVTSHIARKHNKWTDEMLTDEALKYKTRQEFRDNNQKAYQAAKARGDEFYNSITSHMDYQRTQWTDELLKNEALKYITRNQFAKGSPNAYTVARRKGDDFFNEITSHMPKKVNQWTDEDINTELPKYKNYSEFLKNSKLYSVLKHQKKLQIAKDYYTS